MAERASDPEEWLCVFCGTWSPESKWLLVEDAIDCEDCGSHDALICPSCEEYTDAWVWPPKAKKSTGS